MTTEARLLLSPRHRLPNWPYLTDQLPGLGALVKQRPEDFQVEEVPQYLCCGQGDHTYFWVEKTGITTLELVRRLARHLNRKERDFGYAGLKDSRAVTRQRMSLEHIEPKILLDLALPNVKILSVDRHTNKLKLGHLAGNKFVIKLRRVESYGKQVAEECLQILQKRGVPNYFGLQRFGVRGDSWIMGKAIIGEDPKEFVDQFCGRPAPQDRDMVRRARELYDKGEFELASEVWPGYFRDAKRACRILAGNKSSYPRAFAAIDTKLKRLFVSAYQSYLFNDVLARRIREIDRLEPGDLACKHVNGAVFLVEDAPVEQARADGFEISPTGPLFGYRIRLAEGRPGQVEQEVLTAEALALDDFRKPKGHKVKGSRRPLRVRIKDLAIETGADEHGEFLLLTFEMPSGAYATAVLRELMKERLLTQDRLTEEGA